MRHHVVGLCSVVLAVSTAGCASRDMDQWCQIATEVEADDSVPADQKMRTVSQRFSPMSSDVKNIHKAVATVSADRRYEIVEHAARNELGLADWACPALERLFDEAGQPDPAP